MSTYKAVVVANLGSDDVGVRELTMLRPSEGQLLVEVHAAGLSFPDLLIMQGKHMIRMKPPYVPGSEVCGRVVAAGSSTGYLKGDWVFGSTKTGGLAEFCLMEVEDTYLLPRGVAPVAAAGFELNYGTAFHGLSDLADLQADDILLVLGASGGVGLAAVGIGKMRGARVVACASSGAKRRACQAAGADMVLDYGRDGVGFRETLSEAGIYGAVDVVFDPVGGQWSETSLRALGWGGRFVTVGFAAGGVNPKAVCVCVCVCVLFVFISVTGHLLWLLHDSLFPVYCITNSATKFIL